MADARVGSVVIVVIEPRFEGTGAAGGVRVGARIRPTFLQGADEALRLAVGLGRIGLGVDVPDPKAPTGSVEQP